MPIKHIHFQKAQGYFTLVRPKSFFAARYVKGAEWVLTILVLDSLSFKHHLSSWDKIKAKWKQQYVLQAGRVRGNWCVQWFLGFWSTFLVHLVSDPTPAFIWWIPSLRGRLEMNPSHRTWLRTHSCPLSLPEMGTVQILAWIPNELTTWTCVTWQRVK